MKKLLTILITGSLALAASAIAQQDEATPQPKKKHRQGEQQSTNGTQTGTNEARPGGEAKPANERQMQNQRAARRQHAQDDTTTPATEAPERRGRNGGQGARQRGRQMRNEQATPTETAPETKPAPAAPANTPEATNKAAASAPATAPAQTTAPAAAQTNAAKPAAPNPNARAKKPAPQVVQQIKIQHQTFKAQPKPSQVPAVTFNQNYRIVGAERWQGPQYEVFRAYRPQFHDQGWYRSHYSRVEIIAGGAYYWNNGYYYPAWGYDPTAQYYAYDGPIYVGSRAEPPDRVIADVQSVLQQEGYYKGEVDGLLGPLTREALTGYQTDNGLYPTAAIDQPTLSSLDLG